MADLTSLVWGTAAVNGGVIALVCPGCGAFVSTAYDHSTGVSAKTAHIEFHARVEPAVPGV